MLTALQQVVGQRDLAEIAQFNVRPSEIVDMTREHLRGGGPTGRRHRRPRVRRPARSLLPRRLITEITGAALYSEGQATASLGMLRDRGASRGVPRSQDAAPGQRRHDRQRYAGRAARPRSIWASRSARRRRSRTPRSTRCSSTPASSIVVGANAQGDGAWTTGAATARCCPVAGTVRRLGRRCAVQRQVGNAKSALARIRTELSSYYLLGVETGG